ncbi:hypothetical protein LIER_19249 [Lithospermum erythrorhizon]|uniref:Uncharacterized protein n=1 Tax=Lithospermum erythrorhizon TaxID=34254 RepID=A0AAV3QJL1_LITER
MFLRPHNGVTLALEAHKVCKDYAYTYKKCFSKFGEEDVTFKKFVPSEADWEEVYEVQFLEVFYDVTNLISGSNCPTVNMFLSELSRIKFLINEQLDERKETCEIDGT